MSVQEYHIKSKLAVAYQLIHSPEVSLHIPDTDLLREYSFKKMIKKYDKVYIKPDRGRKSRGVIRIEKGKNGFYKMRNGTNTQQVDSIDLWTKVKEVAGDTKYVIQQAVESVTKGGRHFDLRCHAVRVNGKWKVGGICGRLGQRGSIITTSHHGGTPTLLDTLFSRHLGYSNQQSLNMKRRLEKCVLNTVRRVSQMYPNLIEFAVDIGIDRKKRIWIYEVNIEPLTRGNFKMLPDLTLYRRIQSMRRKAK